MARTVQSAKKGSRTETAISILLVNPEEPGLEPVVSASHPLSKRKMANTSHWFSRNITLPSCYPACTLTGLWDLSVVCRWCLVGCPQELLVIHTVRLGEDFFLCFGTVIEQLAWQKLSDTSCKAVTVSGAKGSMTCREKEQRSLVIGTKMEKLFGTQSSDHKPENSHSRVSGTGMTYSGFNLIMSRRKDV